MCARRSAPRTQLAGGDRGQRGLLRDLLDGFRVRLFEQVSGAGRGREPPPPGGIVDVQVNSDDGVAGFAAALLTRSAAACPGGLIPPASFRSPRPPAGLSAAEFGYFNPRFSSHIQGHTTTWRGR
jgi:hypothetical protein